MYYVGSPNMHMHFVLPPSPVCLRVLSYVAPAARKRDSISLIR